MRMTYLTCDHCGHSIHMPDWDDIPDDWLEVSWNTQADDGGLSAYFCGWRCAYDYCGQMDHQQALRLLHLSGRPS